MGQLVLMGSGETAPSMIKTHRQIFAALPAGRAIVLDSPHGFQMNANDLAERTTTYFRDSIGVDVEAVQWRRAHEPVALARASDAIAQASWVFAGPGSPTYALRVWSETGMSDLLFDVVRRGGAVLLASAAALTAGSLTVPVYEIYKCGADPTWETGLDLVSRFIGASIIVIPHFDNAEGGNHDTRYCYLGEERLQQLESQTSTPIIGIDEHTAVTIDADTRLMSVTGVGAATLRFGGTSTLVPAGASVPFAELRSWAEGSAVTVGTSLGESENATDVEGGVEGGITGEAGEAGGEATQSTPTGSSPDQQINDEVDRLITLLAENVSDDDRRVRMQAIAISLGGIARTGLTESKRTESLVTVIMDERIRARTAKDWETADRLRDALESLEITIADPAT